ncbi:MAG: T9SS type A sorting domain-containing protein [Candidatus Neomarinimicrobiota bacterium]
MFKLRVKHIALILLLFTAFVFAVTDIVPSQKGFIYTDSLYSSLYIKNASSARTLISSPGAGRFFTLSPDNNYIGFKYREVPGGLEAPALLEIETSKIIKLSQDVQLAGQVSFSDDGKIAYSIGNIFHVKDGSSVKTYDLGTYANIVPISPDGEKVVFNDEYDQLWVLNLNSLEKEQITHDDYGKVFPQWSADSRYISFQTLDGFLKIFDTQNKQIRNLGTATDLRWGYTDASYTYTKVNIVDDREIKNTQVISCNAEGTIIYSTEAGKSESIAYIDLNNSLHVFKNGKIQVAEQNSSLFKRTKNNEEFVTEPVTFAQTATSEDEYLTVPYVHQVYDTPGSRGYSSCAPTTASMVLAYYKLIPKWPFVSGFGNLSNYGAYVHERYYYNDNYFDQTYTDCNSSKSYCYTCYGGMGYMWTGGSPNSRMAGYYEKHGLSAKQTWNTTWSAVRSEIDKKKPFSICNFLSSSGHLTVAIGRVSGTQRTVIMHDPYGDRNSSSWPNYYGKAVKYDWPGYNHGHASLNYANSGYSTMPWCIATSYAQPAYPDSIIDDKQFENGFYLKAEGNTVPMRYYRSTKSGYGNHHWWTYTEENEKDQCYATWTPNIDSAAYYEVFAYIPASATASTAKYRINHTAGKSDFILDQSSYSDEWASLGKYFFRNDGSDFIYLGDSTGLGSQKIAFDAIRWDRVEVQNLDFTSDYRRGYTGFEIKFWVNAPVSEGNYNYTWDFGNGETATGDTLIYKYTETGTFDVLLTAETNGIYFSTEKTAYIEINPNEGNFDLLYPGLASIIQTSRPMLSWEKEVSGSSQTYVYGLCLALTPEFKDTLFKDITSERFCEVLTDLPENKNIYWQVSCAPDNFSWESDANKLYSKVAVFTVNAHNSPPLQFSLIAPENKSIEDTFRPVFSWLASSDKDPGDTLRYKLNLGNSKDSMICIYTGRELSYTMKTELIENGHYYWYVEAIDASNASTRSDESYREFSINTVNEAPPAPIQLAPNDMSYQTTRYPTFIWTAVVDPDPGDEVTYKMFYWYEGSNSIFSVNTVNTTSDGRRFGDKREYSWTVAAIDKAGLMTFSDTLTVFIDIELDVIDIPHEFSLKGNYPNPFNPLTRISYGVPNSEKVNISLYDVSGKLISTLFNDIQQPGQHSIELDASGLPSGIYIYKMVAGEFTASSKMLLLK